MDYVEEPPERYWATAPELHPEMINCAQCGAPLDKTHSIPVYVVGGSHNPLCVNCAPDYITDHPVTPEYLMWLETGDHRWWSVWLCQHCQQVPEEELLL